MIGRGQLATWWASTLEHTAISLPLGCCWMLERASFLIASFQFPGPWFLNFLPRQSTLYTRILSSNIIGRSKRWLERDNLDLKSIISKHNERTSDTTYIVFPFSNWGITPVKNLNNWEVMSWNPLCKSVLGCFRSRYYPNGLCTSTALVLLGLMDENLGFWSTLVIMGFKSWRSPIPLRYV
jgi:hypothetical protein